MQKLYSYHNTTVYHEKNTGGDHVFYTTAVPTLYAPPVMWKIIIPSSVIELARSFRMKGGTYKSGDGWKVVWSGALVFFVNKEEDGMYLPVHEFDMI